MNGNRLIAQSILASAILFAGSGNAGAETIRVWGSAVVTNDSIELGDVSRLTGFDKDRFETLTKVSVASAPDPGGSRVLHHDAIRLALREAGVNMAHITIGGAVRCAVSRPADNTRQDEAKAAEERSNAAAGASSPEADRKSATLRAAISEFFNSELARYGGTADIVFDPADDQLLALEGPEFSFEIRRSGGPELGVVTLKVDIRSGGEVVQSTGLTMRVTLLRDVLVAARAINQNAIIKDSDLRLEQLSFSRTNRIGLSRTSHVIGQKARRFMPEGVMIDPDQVESVPLVARGQLVALESTAGSVSIRTTAKAMETGHIGDVIVVRSNEFKKREFEATIVGPGRVRLGRPRNEGALAMHADEGSYR